MNKVHILGASQMINNIEIEHSKFAVMDYAKESIARAIGMELFKSGMIEFHTIGNRDTSDPYFYMTEVIGEVGIACKEDLEHAIYERDQLKLEGANALADEVIKKVANWGSYYGDRMIDKQMVNNIIHDAIREVFKK